MGVYGKVRDVFLVITCILTTVAWPVVVVLVPKAAWTLVQAEVGCWAIPTTVMLGTLLVYVATWVRFRSHWYLCVPPMIAIFLYNGYIALVFDAACHGRAM